jgi:hypothetical protein
MTVALTHVGDLISYTAGSTTITLQWIREGAYSVTTYRGGAIQQRVDERCGSYPTEAEARDVARGYALLAKQAARPSLTEVTAHAQHRQVPPTMAGAHLSAATDAQHRALAQAARAGVVYRGGQPGQAPVTVLTALARKGWLTLTAKPGSRRNNWAYGEITDAGRVELARLDMLAVAA